MAASAVVTTPVVTAPTAPGGAPPPLDILDVLATDGSVVHVRRLVHADQPAVAALHADASDRSIYFRFFTLNRQAAVDYARTITEHDGDTGDTADHAALGAFAEGRLLGVAVYDRVDEHSAEFALLVADEVQHTGIGTLLLETLFASARRAGIDRVVAEVLFENTTMVDVLRHSGYPVRTGVEQGVLQVEMDIDSPAAALAAISSRERQADAASLRAMLAPTSVAVVGASARRGGVGHEILHNIRGGGYTGRLYAVNPHRRSVLGVRTVARAADLPVGIDLAIIAVPADAVRDVVRDLGDRECKAAVVVSSGFGEAGPEGRVRQDELLAVARAAGMRLLGPNCLGIANTDPVVRLNATFAKHPAPPGPLAVAAQSGAFGAGILTAAGAAGLGVAQFASLGNKIDVGGNDLLLTWGDDPRVGVVALYLESIGDPRRFARIALDVARRKPVLAVKSGRTEVGRLAGQSHTAAAASSDAAVDALLRGSGVVRCAGMAELLAAARVLSSQPLPAGSRVAIVGNSGGPEILAADAATEAGLVVAPFGPATCRALAALGVPDRNPLDLGAAAQPPTVTDVLRIVHAAPEVDAVLAVFTEIAVSDGAGVRAAVVAAAAAGKPTVAVEVGSPDTCVPLPDGEHAVPIFSFPEPAAQALGVAAAYGHWQRREAEPPWHPDDVDRDAARRLALTALGEGGGWLAPDAVARLLDLYRIPRSAQHVVHSVPDAARAAAEVGYPVALKLARPGLHKSDVGGIRVGLRDARAVRAAARDLLRLPAEGGDGLLLQPMAAPGVELIAGAVHDAQFGPLVMLGAGGVLTEVLRDRALRLAPLVPGEADRMIGELRAARLLDGYRGTPPVDRAAVRDVLLRVAALVDDVPQIAEMDLNPLVCRGDDVVAVDVRIRVAVPPWHPDPLVRQLRGPVTKPVARPVLLRAPATTPHPTPPRRLP